MFVLKCQSRDSGAAPPRPWYECTIKSRRTHYTVLMTEEMSYTFNKAAVWVRFVHRHWKDSSATVCLFYSIQRRLSLTGNDMIELLALPWPGYFQISIPRKHTFFSVMLLMQQIRWNYYRPSNEVREKYPNGWISPMVTIIKLHHLSVGIWDVFN